MYTTPNLDLIVWDKPEDDFNHTKLADNWIIIDSHDHSGSGKGVKLGTSAFEEESITAALIKFRAIGTNQIALEAVGAAQIKEHGIQAKNIELLTIVNELIANGTIKLEKLDPMVEPLGIIKWWYTPTPEAYTAPVGATTPYEVCDGKEWSVAKGNKMGAGGTELTVGHMPNLIGKYPKGASTEIGAASGSSTVNLSHFHSVSPHSHSVTPHAHAIQEAGQHKHGFHAHDGNYYQVTSRYVEPSFGTGPYINVMHIAQDGTSELAENEADEKMQETGQHTHGGGYTGEATPSTTPVGLTTASALGSTELNPPNVNLLPIMRVR